MQTSFFSVALSGDQTRERERRKVFQMIPTPSESQSFQQGPSIPDLLAVNTSLVAPALAPDAIVSLAEDGGILFRKQFIGAELRQLQEILPLCSSLSLSQLIGFRFEFHYGLHCCFLKSVFCTSSVSFHPPSTPHTQVWFLCFCCNLKSPSLGRTHLIWGKKKPPHTPNPSLCHVSLELQYIVSICSKTGTSQFQDALIMESFCV